MAFLIFNHRFAAPEWYEQEEWELPIRAVGYNRWSVWPIQLPIVISYVTLDCVHLGDDKHALISGPNEDNNNEENCAAKEISGGRAFVTAYKRHRTDRYCQDLNSTGWRSLQRLLKWGRKRIEKKSSLRSPTLNRNNKITPLTRNKKYSPNPVQLFYFQWKNYLYSYFQYEGTTNGS